MPTYFVTFHYTVEVEASDEEHADELAWERFAADDFDQCGVNFVSSKPELLWGEETA